VLANETQSAIEALFNHNYEALRDQALSSGRLLAPDADNLLEALAKCLTEYTCEPEQKAFLAWASEAVTAAAAKLEFFYGLHHECRKSVRNGIWRVLAQNLDLADHSDVSVVLDQIEADTWAWAVEHLDDLMVKGTAKLTTRLFAQGRFHALTWRKNRIRENERFDDADVERFGSDDSSLCPGGGEDGPLPLFFDPGGDEGDEDEQVRRPIGRPAIPAPSDSVIAMKSGRPRMLCPAGCGVQAISPIPATHQNVLKLWCGHERPILLPAAA
jgi:phenylpyruvate tautomerase PptA (4-oxalocrotonate tautomerase family)